MMVVVFHFHENLFPSVHEWLPKWISAVCLNGNLGVEIFFVLSGFVIAHSVRDGERSARYLLRFGLRRSIRLDPPLWITIAVELLLMRLSLLFFPHLATAIPTWQTVAANVMYLQRFLGLPNVLPVFWSLTYEVQFYAVLVSGLVVWHRIPAAYRPDAARNILFLGAFYLSIAIWLGALPLPFPGLFIDRWFQFALGIVAWCCVSKRISVGIFIGFCATVVAAILALHAPAYRAHSSEVAVAAAMLIVSAAALGRMQSWLCGRASQFLARISYSLYLVHLSVGWRLISLVRTKAGPSLNPIVASATLVAAILCSIAAAYVMHAVVEQPSLKLARHIRLPRRNSGEGRDALLTIRGLQRN